MIFQRGTPKNTQAIFPTRHFRLVLDPACQEGLTQPSARGALALIRDLQHASEPITITILYPSYLTFDGSPPAWLASFLTEVSNSRDVPNLPLSVYLDEGARQALQADDDEPKRARALIALADAAQADALVTSAGTLIQARYELLQHHRIRVVPLAEFPDVVEVCAHGFSIFWSASDDFRFHTVDVFYQTTHWKGRRLARWFWTRRDSLPAGDLRDNLHNALLNRYPFVTYARDMVRFYELQLDYFARRGLWRRFAALLGYHMTNFYIYLWGMLEHLTLIANLARVLNLEERQCGIQGQAFQNALRLVEPALARYITEDPIREWISTMADVRHAAAHRQMLEPNDILAETPESKKSDKEIAAILRQEHPELYTCGSEAMIRALEPEWISNWRVKKMRAIATNAVYVKRPTNPYFRMAVTSVDYDLTMLNAMIDAFLVTLFRRPA